MVLFLHCRVRKSLRRFRMISKEIEIEDLVREIPESVILLKERGIRCLRCGEPIWSTLEEAAKGKGFSDKQIENVVFEINNLKGN